MKMLHRKHPKQALRIGLCIETGPMALVVFLVCHFWPRSGPTRTTSTLHEPTQAVERGGRFPSQTSSDVFHRMTEINTKVTLTNW